LVLVFEFIEGLSREGQPRLVEVIGVTEAEERGAFNGLLVIYNF
jgi:hypothetical protein